VCSSDLEVDITRKDTLGDPYIIKKQTQTVLIVKDGETIVISGLTKQTNSSGESGWPWLKDVPILGWVFKSDSKNDKMEEVLIFITPHILQVNSNSQSVAAPIVEGTSPKKDTEVNQKETEHKVN
jgi:type II secretory pathway component GspD/PulD (secretin)